MIIRAISEIANNKQKTKELINRSKKNKKKKDTSFSEMLEKEIIRLEGR